MLFTEKCEHAIASGKLHTFKKELEAQLEGYTGAEIGGEGADAHVLELKLKALILDLIHFIDVIDQLQKDNVRSTGDWVWQKQLRFYLDKKGEIMLLNIGARSKNSCR